MSADHGHAHSQGHSHDGAHADVDLDTMFSAPFWDERYRSGENQWSGNPNPQLVERVAGLTPGRALEAGAGDGSDAIWLARQGWTVEAVDVSQVALDLGAERAAAAGVGDRVSGRQADLRTWAPEPAAYDLVTAFFLHLPGLDDVNRRLASAVRPGGTLLVVLHHPSHLANTEGHWGGPEMFKTSAEVAAVLDPADWEITAEDPVRPNTRPQFEMDTLQDAIVQAVRR